jgi:hypothetical protein
MMMISFQQLGHCSTLSRIVWSMYSLKKLCWKTDLLAPQIVVFVDPLSTQSKQHGKYKNLPCCWFNKKELCWVLSCLLFCIIEYNHNRPFVFFYKIKSIHMMVNNIVTCEKCVWYRNFRDRSNNTYIMGRELFIDDDDMVVVVVYNIKPPTTSPSECYIVFFRACLMLNERKQREIKRGEVFCERRY